jgi:hypothetical protein
MTTKTLLGATRDVVLSTGRFGGARCWKDVAPENPTFPYAVMTTVTGPNPILLGDGHTKARETTIQVSLWERLRDEDPDVRTALLTALDSAALVPDVGTVYGCRVHDTQRLSEPDNEVVQTALTLIVRHTPDVGV